MKVVTIFFAFIVANATAFAPTPVGRSATCLQEKLADKIFGMDLFAPNRDVNTYGARKKKNLKVGKITEKSYIPNGLTAEQYKKVRAEEQKKKDANYQKNVQKAFKFTDFTEWYKKRGTEEAGSWLKSAGKGHTFAKTKYDYSGGKDDAKKFESFTSGSIFSKKK